MHERRGVTLIELTVALLLLSVGALALAGSAAITLRRMSDGSRGSAAASVARSRAETAFSQPCGSLNDGNQSIRGVRSEWSVAGGPFSTDVRQRVTYSTKRGEHLDEFLTTVPCR